MLLDQRSQTDWRCQMKRLFDALPQVAFAPQESLNGFETERRDREGYVGARSVTAIAGGVRVAHGTRHHRSPAQIGSVRRQLGAGKEYFVSEGGAVTFGGARNQVSDQFSQHGSDACSDRGNHLDPFKGCKSYSDDRSKRCECDFRLVALRDRRSIVTGVNEGIIHTDDIVRADFDGADVPCSPLTHRAVGRKVGKVDVVSTLYARVALRRCFLVEKPPDRPEASAADFQPKCGGVNVGLFAALEIHMHPFQAKDVFGHLCLPPVFLPLSQPIAARSESGSWPARNRESAAP